MQALILAAGQGSRLGDQRGRPKCLREIGGVPLVHYQLAALEAAGITDVVMVVGFGAEQVRDAVGPAATYVVNERFAETNSMVSFMLGQRLVRDDVVVLNCDVFGHPAMTRMLADADGDALLYDSGSGDEDEQMKVHLREGRLVEMSKTLPASLVGGENVGMLRMSRDTAAAVGEAATAIAEAGGHRGWLASAVNEVAADHSFRCLDVAGWPWVEIDFPEDLVRARAEVFPEVARTVDPLENRYALEDVLMRRVS